MADFEHDPLWPRPSPLQVALEEGRDGRLLLWITLNAPNIVEIAGVAGVDAVIIDVEHGAFGLEAVEAMTTAAELAGLTVLARPSELGEVTRLLDIGAAGIVFPMIASAEDAAAARATLAYPPAGTRGWSGAHVRRARWTGPAGLRTPAYLAAVDASVLSLFLIETPAGVEAIDAILDAGEPDGVIFGWGDFGAAAGFDANEALDAAGHVYDACRRRGVGVALDPNVALVPDFYPGCFWIAGVDSTLISAALRARVHELRPAQD